MKNIKTFFLPIFLIQALMGCHSNPSEELKQYVSEVNDNLPIAVTHGIVHSMNVSNDAIEIKYSSDIMTYDLAQKHRDLLKESLLLNLAYGTFSTEDGQELLELTKKCNLVYRIIYCNTMCYGQHINFDIKNEEIEQMLQQENDSVVFSKRRLQLSVTLAQLSLPIAANPSITFTDNELTDDILLYKYKMIGLDEQIKDSQWRNSFIQQSQQNIEEQMIMGNAEYESFWQDCLRANLSILFIYYNDIGDSIEIRISNERLKEIL